jgi:lysophospholipase L1-like esterase
MDDINFIGRIYNSSYIIGDWSGVTFRFIVSPIQAENNLEISLQLNVASTDDYYIGYFVDYMDMGKYLISPSTSNTITVAPYLTAGWHVIDFIKLNEPTTGSMNLTSYTIQNGYLQKRIPSNQIKSRFLFIGDSFTAGYGVDGIPPCEFSSDTENIMHSYATLVAQTFNAQLEVVAYSGIGIVRNFGETADTSPDPLPVYYNRTIAFDPSTYWNPKLFPVTLAFIMLGKNDYWTYPGPPDGLFTDRLASFLLLVAEDYPNSKIIAAVAPGAGLNQSCNTMKAAERAGATFFEFNSTVMDGGTGCNGHPNQASMQLMAKAVTPVISKVLGIQVEYPSSYPIQTLNETNIARDRSMEIIDTVLYTVLPIVFVLGMITVCIGLATRNENRVRKWLTHIGIIRERDAAIKEIRDTMVEGESLSLTHSDLTITS